MIAGIPIRRAMIYLSFVAALAAAFIWRTSAPEVSSGRDTAMVPAATQIQLSVFNVGQAFEGFSDGADRDLFAAKAPEKPAPPPAPTPKPAPSGPSAEELAAAEIRKVFDSLKILGILGSGEGPVIILEIEGQVVSAALGQEVIPGYVVGSVSLEHFQLRHEDTGLVQTYLVDASGN